MIDQLPLQECVGCSACATVCKFNAVELISNEEGFLFPRLNKELCTECKACLIVCPLTAEKKFERFSEPMVYASWSNDDEIRRTSSSGGLFSELALRTFTNGGVVYGAAFDNAFKLRHRGIESKEELQLLKGSKYLQSELVGIFKDLKDRLKTNQNVLFVGTPCQVAGLNSFLQKDHKNLLTCDVICHGVASPGVFEKYIDELEDENSSKVIGFQFRNKDKGWRDFCVEMVFENGTRLLEPFAQNLYMKGFLADIFLRPSCHECKYSRIPRVADITLGDFWGIWDIQPQWDKNEGVTALLLNSEKALAVLQDLKNIKKNAAELSWVLKGNPSLSGSVLPHKKRSTFFRLYRKELQFTKIMKKCLPPTSYFEKIVWSINRRLQRIYGR